MYVKIYSYHVQMDKASDLLEVQDRAHRLYAKYVTSRSMLLRHRADPSRWLEIQSYQDEQTYQDGSKAISSDPEAAELWEAFLATLASDKIVEDEYEQIAVLGER
jgi:hypothetical protein